MVFPVLTVLLLVVACPAVFSQDDVEGSGAPGDDDPAAADCECSDITLLDGNSGKNVGNCLTSINGKFWCYVSSISLCSDKIKSPRASGLFYSFQACLAKKEPRPSLYGVRKQHDF
eukprot:GFUD01079573.1.p1 GENE.GFUD01079573.1~~GFUD01079573.1.p1  ORF type:complete len:116 (-),score=30.87 GFUD01079573.1:137-484(-)